MSEKTITLKEGDLDQLLRDALRLGAQDHGVTLNRLARVLMEGAQEKAYATKHAGREYGISVEREEDKVFADFLDVESDEHTSTYGDAKHVLRWLSKRMGVPTLSDALLRAALAEAELSELKLAEATGQVVRLPEGVLVARS